MKPSEFVRNISEADVALGRLRGFTCTESRCEGKWKTCDDRDVQIAQMLLDGLRKFGLPDLLAELEKVVGRPVTVDDVCAFWGTYWLYSDCVLSEMSEERCREEYQRVLERLRKGFEDARERKKRLENLLRKLSSAVDQFKLWYIFVGLPTYLELPLPGCGTELELKYDPSREEFMIIYHPPYKRPLAREAGEWFAEAVEGALRGLGINKYETTTDYGEVVTRLPGPDPGAALDLFGLFVDLVPLLNDVCAVLPMRRVAEKTGVRVRV